MQKPKQSQVLKIQSRVEAIVEKIHSTDHQLVFEFAGAGVQALAWLHSVGGSSRTILEATDRYAAKSLLETVGFEPATFASRQVAMAMAAVAYQRARQLVDSETPVLGVSCTAAIATDRTKSGEHRGVVATFTPDKLTTYHVTLTKGARDRPEEERLISLLILKAVATSCRVDFDLALPLHPNEALIEHSMPLELFHRLIEQEVVTVTVSLDGYLIADEQFANPALLSGSFNPLHAGHRQMAELAAERLDCSLYFELPVINADKDPIDAVEVCRRVAQFADEAPVVLTTAPLFSQKAQLFPGATFVVGVDTAVRLVQPRFYQNDPKQMRTAFEQIRKAGCRFLVVGRLADDEFLTLADLDLPAEHRDLFEGVAEEEFRVDISSTEIRQSR